MSELLKRLKANSTIKESCVLKDSIYFTDKDEISTEVYAYNVALTGSLTGGFGPGLNVLAGPSKNFKTGFMLLMIKAYLDKYKDAVCLFYDSEFGAPQGYFASMGIDTNRVMHTPIMNIEELRHDLSVQLEKNIKRGDKVFIAVDSVGNLASKKEVDDAIEGSNKADMTRAKVLKSMFRIVTPYLTKHDIPMVVINHTYKTLEMFSKDVVSGGTGVYYSANNIFIMGRQQDKDTSGLNGFNFVINAEKSRAIKEKSKILINVNFETGINKYSGLLEMALESGHVIKPKQGWYSKVDMETGEVFPEKYREKDTSTKQFWKSILADQTFHKWVEDKYKLPENMEVQDEVLASEVELLLENEE